MAMMIRASFIPILILLFTLRTAPAYSAPSLDASQDSRKVATDSNSPANAPTDAQIKDLSKESDTRTGSEADSIEAPEGKIPERPSHVATQGEFAIQLVEELGLSNKTGAKEAADILTSVRISPQLGRWELDQPMTPELAGRLRTLTVAAAQKGRITITSEQALLAFDTAAALLDAPIPMTPAPKTPESPPPIVETPPVAAAPAPDIAVSPYPILEAPPVVYLYPPPPELDPYYFWVPVAGGFWWNNFLFPGFFSLDVDLFFLNHDRFFFRDHRNGLNSADIGRHFRNHIIGHRLVRSPVTSNVGRSAFGVRPPFASNRINFPLSPRQGLRSLGSRPRGGQTVRAYGPSRPMMTRPTIRRPSFPSHATGRMPTFR